MEHLHEEEKSALTEWKKSVTRLALSVFMDCWQSFSHPTKHNVLINFSEFWKKNEISDLTDFGPLLYNPGMLASDHLTKSSSGAKVQRKQQHSFQSHRHPAKSYSASKVYVNKHFLNHGNTEFICVENKFQRWNYLKIIEASTSQLLSHFWLNEHLRYSDLYNSFWSK